eukprot:1425578-Amphidinium_carterae.1
MLDGHVNLSDNAVSMRKHIRSLGILTHSTVTSHILTQRLEPELLGTTTPGWSRQTSRSQTQSV